MGPRRKPATASRSSRKAASTPARDEAGGEEPLVPAAAGRFRSVGAGVRELSWSSFDALALELARGLSRRFEPDAVVGVAKGGVFVGGAVASALRRDFYPVRISRRSRDQLVRSRPKAYGSMPRDLKGKRVLVVDDVAASGETLVLACELARKVGASEVRTATLAVRPGGFRPDWFALETQDLVVFPWDYDFFPGAASGERLEAREEPGGEQG